MINIDLTKYKPFLVQKMKDGYAVRNSTEWGILIKSFPFDIYPEMKDIPKNDWFDEFYEVFPVYVTRPDGTKGFLRSNLNKCRKEYNRIVGKSRAMHEHLLNCLNWEINNKMMTGKLGYMKTMWKWLTQQEWESLEEQMQYEQEGGSYGYQLR